MAAFPHDVNYASISTDCREVVEALGIPLAWQRGDSGICEKGVRKNWIQTGIYRRAVVDFDVNASSSMLYRSHGVY